MIQPIIEKTYLVEVNLSTLSAQTKTNFLYVPQLENVQIYGVQTFSATDLAVSPNGKTVVASAGLAALTVTFVVGDTEEIFLMPCADLRSANIAGFVRMFNNKTINITKSYVTIQTITGLNLNESVLFQFLYR